MFIYNRRITALDNEVEEGFSGRAWYRRRCIHTRLEDDPRFIVFSDEWTKKLSKLAKILSRHKMNIGEWYAVRRNFRESFPVGIDKAVSLIYQEDGKLRGVVTDVELIDFYDRFNLTGWEFSKVLTGLRMAQRNF